jgi:hypothetical protein
MSKAKRKHISKPLRRQPRKANPDSSVEPGLQYFAAYQTWALVEDERLKLQEVVEEQYPQSAHT